MERGTLLKGLVRPTGSTSPIENARVYITEAPGIYPDIAALTDAQGRFSLFVSSEGSYKLECAAEGYLTASVTFEITGERELLNIDFELVEGSTP